MASYCEPVRTNLDAATAYKVEKAYDRTMRKRGAIGSWSIHQSMRSYSAYFKKGGKYYEVQSKPVSGLMLVLRRDLLSHGENRRCLYYRHFQVVRELCLKTIFTLSEPWWLRPQGSRKH